MSSEWKVYQIQDIAAEMGDAPFGSNLKNHDYTGSGALVVQGRNIQGRECDWSDRRYVSFEKYEQLKKNQCCVGDLVFPKVGTIGKVGLLSPAVGVDKYVLSTNTMMLRVDEALAYSDFVYYFFTWPRTSALIHSFNSKSVQPVFNFTSLKRFEILLPTLNEQKHISDVLRSLDDRIALLRETNATLEAIAQALFKSWFVDFDPVRAKAEGRQPDGMDAATAALFPDSFEESELGLVPKGWRVFRVEDLMELAYGKALKATDRVDGQVPVYGSGGITGYHDQSLLEGPGIIVGRKGTVGSLYWEDCPFFPIDTVFYVKAKKPLTYCYYLLRTLGLEGMNTDGAVPGLNRGNAYRLRAVVPPEAVLEGFDGVASRLRGRIFANAQQAQTLTQLRDILLPRLISGQLRLPEAEALIEEAV